MKKVLKLQTIGNSSLVGARILERTPKNGSERQQLNGRPNLNSVNQSPCRAHRIGANSRRTRMSSASAKIALFIDGITFTPHRLQAPPERFQGRGTLLPAFYYTAIIEDQEFSSIRPLVDWLDYNGYTVVTKATKEHVHASGRRKVKGDMRARGRRYGARLTYRRDDLVFGRRFPHADRSGAAPWRPASRWSRALPASRR
ncbi:hypothetical protein V1272_001179 [Bradyrhizobium sp. AZCC 1708]